MWPDGPEPPSKDAASELSLLNRLLERKVVSPLILTQPPPRARILSISDCMPDASPCAATLTPLETKVPSAIIQAPRKGPRVERRGRRCARNADADASAGRAAALKVNAVANGNADERLARLAGRCECTGKGPRRDSARPRTWCHIYLDLTMLNSDFDLVQKLIGRGGCNTRAIFEATGTKVRIRGRGSGHQEQGCKSEANAHLMIAITADCSRTSEFRKAFEMTRDLVARIAQRFDEFSGKTNDAGRFWLGGWSEDVPRLLDSITQARDIRAAKPSTRRRM